MPSPKRMGTSSFTAKKRAAPHPKMKMPLPSGPGKRMRDALQKKEEKKKTNKKEKKKKKRQGQKRKKQNEETTLGYHPGGSQK